MESVRPSRRPYRNHIWCGALPLRNRSALIIMTSKILIASLLVLALVALGECGGHGGGGGDKHVVIHVPIKHTNVHTKKIVTKHIKIVGTDDGEVVSYGGEGGDAFSQNKVSGSIHIGQPTYSHGHHHGWH